MIAVRQGYRIVIDPSVAEYRALRLIRESGVDALDHAVRDLMEAQGSGFERRVLMAEAILDEVRKRLNLVEHAEGRDARRGTCDLRATRTLNRVA